MWAFCVVGRVTLMCQWHLATIALSKVPNCVVELQKQFSSSASKKHKAALQRGWGVCAAGLAVCCTKSDGAQRGQAAPAGLAEAELDSSLWRTPGEQKGSGGSLALEDPESTGGCGRRPGLGTGSPVNWAGMRLESSLFHVARWV